MASKDGESVMQGQKSIAAKSSQASTNFRMRNFNNTSQSLLYKTMPKKKDVPAPGSGDPDASMAQLTKNALYKLQLERIQNGHQRSNSDIMSMHQRSDTKSAINSLVIKKRLKDFQKKAFGFQNVEMVGQQIKAETTMNEA